MSVTLNRDLCAKFKVSKRFTHVSEPPITSLDYDDSGQFLISTSMDESIQLYDSTKGKHLKPVYSKKYGCHLAKFTHHQKNCVYASTKTGEDNTIRYLSLNDNSYIRYFRGHKGLVNSLEVSPKSDVFISASMDETVKLWDLRSSNPQASVPSQGETILSFDPLGLIVAVSNVTKGTVKFLDLKMFDADPFQEITLPHTFKWNKVEFSNDNKYILFCSTNQGHLIYDAFDFVPVTTLTGMTPIPPSPYASTGCASFSPDGKYVFSGNGVGNVAVWSLKPGDLATQAIPDKLNPIKYLDGDDRPRICLWNPKYMQFTTADSSINMWIPDSY
jgi:COMPASS component SWD2